MNWIKGKFKLIFKYAEMEICGFVPDQERLRSITEC